MSTLEYKIEVMQAALKGKEIEVTDDNWESSYTCFHPNWDWHNCEYRVKQYTPLQIPWEIIDSKWKWAYKQSDGKVYLSVDMPILLKDRWRTYTHWVLVSSLMCIPESNIPWQDSLIERPKD